MSEIRILKYAIDEVIGENKDYLPVTYKNLKEIIAKAEEIRLDFLGTCPDRSHR